MAERAVRARERRRVLVVDDQEAMAEMLAEGLTERGFDMIAVHRGEQAIELLESNEVDAVVTDLRMAPVDGFALLARSRRLDPERPVIIMTAYSAIDSAVDAIRQGAYHYLAKPFPLDELCIFLSRALDERAMRRETSSLRRALGTNEAPGIVAKSPVMQRVMEVVERVAGSAAAVLITGETGTGKGRVAAAIHARSARARARFVAVNCAAVPETLLESELFGHVKGAFTGATGQRTGLFVEADGGTLFLDEIGDMPVSLQAKLLHVLDHRGVRPVGADRERQVDVRVIAATNRDLRCKVAEGTFREDLLYRLEVIRIELPPLRARPEDLTALIHFFFEDACKRYPASPARSLSREALSVLLSYGWPGNVRELAHAMERVVLLAPGAQIGPEGLPGLLQSALPARGAPAFQQVLPMREMQRIYASWAFEQLGHNRTRTAERLGIDYKTLARLLD